MNIAVGETISNKYWFSRNSMVINVTGISADPGVAEFNVGWIRHSLLDGSTSTGSTTLYVYPVKISSTSYSYRIDLSNLFSSEKNCLITFSNSLLTPKYNVSSYSLINSNNCCVIAGGKSKSVDTDGITYYPFIGILLTDKDYVTSTSDKIYVLHSSASNTSVYAKKNSATYGGTSLFTAGAFKVSYVQPALLGDGVSIMYVYSGGTPSTLRTFSYAQGPTIYENLTIIKYLNSYGVYDEMRFYSEKTDVHEITPSEQQSQFREDGQEVFSVKRGTIRRKYTLSSGYLSAAKYAALLDLLMSEETTCGSIPVQVTCSGIERNSAGREPFSTELTIETLYDDVI